MSSVMSCPSLTSSASTGRVSSSGRTPRPSTTGLHKDHSQALEELQGTGDDKDFDGHAEHLPRLLLHALKEIAVVGGQHVDVICLCVLSREEGHQLAGEWGLVVA